MVWSDLAGQFCLELAFGAFLGLAWISRAPMGVFFYRMMGTVALLALVAGSVGQVFMGSEGWRSPRVLAGAAAALSFPFLCGAVRASTRRLALWWSVALTAIAIVFTVRIAPGVRGGGDLLLGSLSAMATGAVAGGVGLAMVVGHWYLTVPQLPIDWLRRLNRFTVGAMVASVVLVTFTCVQYADSMAQADVPLLGPWGLFYLSARVAVGLALPLLFAWMTAGSLKYENTRSATGILYASTVLVLIGTAASLSLQDSYGMPL